MIDLLMNCKAVLGILDKGGTLTEQDRKDLKEKVSSETENHQGISKLITSRCETMVEYVGRYDGIHIYLPLNVKKLVGKSARERQT